MRNVVQSEGLFDNVQSAGIFEAIDYETNNHI